MKQLLALALGLGWAFAGARNAPRVEHASAAAFGVAVAGSIWLAYWCGTRRRQDSAVAAAVAKAEARAAAVAATSSRATANQSVTVVLDPANGASQRGARVYGLDDAPWLAGATVRREVEDEEMVLLAVEDAMGREAGEHVER